MEPVSLCLGGDVMTGRGVDQLFAAPAPPQLWEPSVRDACTYLDLAQRASGPVPRPVDPTYPWGDALALLADAQPHAVLCNLETAVTRRGTPDSGKAVHYRQAPEQVGCLTAPGAQVPGTPGARTPVAYALANNHLLDFGPVGLADTLRTLAAAGVPAAGAGSDASAAARPAVLPLATGGRVVFVAYGATSSGIPEEWAATPDRPGVALLPDLSPATADRVAAEVQQDRLPGDVVVVSLHWGSNWGHTVPEAHVTFAHRLVDGGVDVVHGHSAHHPRAVEFYRGRLVLYGCGDLIDDYEGIEGHERYRGDLRPLYLATVRPGTGELVQLRVAVFRSWRLRLRRAPPDDAAALAQLLDRASHRYGTRARVTPAASGDLLVLEPSRHAPAPP